MSKDAEPWCIVATGLCVHVRLTPKAQRDCIVGQQQTTAGSALTVRVRAAPEAGAANAAAARVIADWLDVPTSAVSLATGAKSRFKTFVVRGTGKALAAVAAARLTDLQSNKGTGHA